MLQRLHCLLLLAAVAFLASPATSAAVAVDAAAEQALPETPNLNLARRFTSPFAQLRERRTSRVGLAGAQKKRTLSDELLDMLRGVNLYNPAPSAHAAAGRPGPSAGVHAAGPFHTAGPSAKVTAAATNGGQKPRPSATWAAQPGASQQAGWKRWYGAFGASQNAHAATNTAKPYYGASQHAHAATNTAKPYYGASQMHSTNAHAATATAKPMGASQMHNTHAATNTASLGENTAAAHPMPSMQPANSHAAAAMPQPSALYDSAAGKAAKVVEYVKRMIQQEPWESLDSRLLCPAGETACPIFPRMGTYECLDTAIELQSCGGCASKGQGEDCTAIKGAQGVTCESGKCLVYSCEPGFTLDASFRRSNGGTGRCKRLQNPKRARSLAGQ
ncbi:hypothetical protein JCM8202_002554 [Rhodotorula sphaerocarpa]